MKYTYINHQWVGEDGITAPYSTHTQQHGSEGWIMHLDKNGFKHHESSWAIKSVEALFTNNPKNEGFTLYDRYEYYWHGKFIFATTEHLT